LGKLIKANVIPVPSCPVSFRVFQRDSVSGKSKRVPSDDEIAVSILDKAKAEAAIIVRTARSEEKTLLEEARKGGHQAGMAEAMALVGPLIAKLEADVNAFDAETAAFFESLEPEILKLCCETVEKVIRHEIHTDPKVVMRVIRHCLHRVKESHEVRIRVNPSELESVRATRGELLSLAEGVKTINIVDDRRVSPGGCIIETATGDFDATIETQLEKVEQTFTEIFENDCNETNA
jgi:flagellar assembly protein FliH